MSKSKLRAHVWVCAIGLVAYAIIYIIGEQLFHDQSWVEALGELIPLAVAVPAVFLAAAFARRNSYLQALRDLWSRLVPTAQSVIQYTYLPSPKQTDFANVQQALGIAIDELRSVFANIPLSRDSVGLYPYENLKDIKHVVDWLGYGDNLSESDVLLARRCIIKLWREMHNAMLSEFDRDVPEVPVSKYLGDGTSIADLLARGTLKESDLKRDTLASRPRVPGPDIAGV